jgi:HEAT repeat protein
MGKSYRISQIVLSTVVWLLLPITAYAQETPGQGNSRSTARIQSLIEKLRSAEDDVRFEAATSLSKIGREAIPSLNEALNREKGYARVYAARVLRSIEQGNQAAQSTLTSVTKDNQEKLDVRRFAAYVLALSSSGVPLLVKMLDDRDSFVRRSAAFALYELFDISGHLSADYKPALTEVIPIMVAAMGDDDAVVSGIAAESVEQIRGDIDFLLDKAAQSPNNKLKQSAKEVLVQRKRGKKETGQQVTMDMKPGAEDAMKKNKGFLYGNLGVIYALAIGGEPVQDFRSIPGTVGALSLRVTINSRSRQASSGLSRFSPYTDVR